MCFWFGLEILRLVYKKVFFEILNGNFANIVFLRTNLWELLDARVLHFF